MNLTWEINHFYYRMALHELQIMNGGDLYNGLSYNSLLYLNVIEQMQDCTASQIADALGVTKPAVASKLGELLRQGHIVRQQSETDRRVYYIRLSPQIERTFSVYDEVFARIEPALRKTYTDEQLALFGEILHTISEHEWRKPEHE